MPPITIVFVASGLAVWLNALYFLGVGSQRTDDGPDPLRTVGAATFLVGIVDLTQAVYIMAARPAPLGTASVVLAGLIAFYGVFFVILGWTELAGLDLRPVGNLAIAVAIVPLFWWRFFDGGWMFRSILVLWVVAFASVAATIYGRLRPRPLGTVLLGTSAYSFFVPAIILALGKTIP